MFTSGGGPGEVHSYFSPYSNAYDAAITLFSVLSDMHYRLKERAQLADEPFRFFTIEGEFTGQEALTQKSLCTVLELVDDCSLEQHMEKGDLARWIRFGLGNDKLAAKVEQLSDVKGDRLRKRLVKCLETKDKAEVKISEVIQEKSPDISD
jgi:alpha-amylase